MKEEDKTMKMEKGGREITKFVVLLWRNHTKIEEFLEIKLVHRRKKAIEMVEGERR